ncbi:MAG: hypothetical protein V3S64_07140 [bacterium]
MKRAAEAYADAVLGKDASRDFSFQRFDASEMIKGQGAHLEDSALSAFQIACECAPFLCDRWVVRLDRIETVKRRDQAAQNLRRELESLRIFSVLFEEAAAWAAEDDLPATDVREGGAGPQHLVSSVESGSGKVPVLTLTPRGEAGRFLLSQGGKRRVVDGRAFLKKKLKGRFEVSGQMPEGPSVPSEQGAPSEQLYALLERLISSPPPGLHLLLTAGASRESDLSRPLLTLLRKSGSIEKFITYDDYNPIDWVIGEAKARNISLNRSLAELMIHFCGNDLARLSSELDKLALVFGGGGVPDEEEWLRALSSGQGGSLFPIAERLGHRDLEGALGILENFLAETPGAHPLLIGILSKHIRQMLHIHDLMRLEVHESEWASNLKLHPFLAKRLAGQAKRFSAPELEQILRALAVLDHQLKYHSHLTPSLLRDFVLGVCRGDFARPGADLVSLPELMA